MKYGTASVAHELRTPMTIVQGYLQGIRDGIFTADEAQLDLMLKQMDSLGNLVDDLKTISLADSGQLKLNLESVNLADIAQQTVEIIRPEYPDIDIRFDSNDHAEFITRCDSDRVKQLLMGLINNSARYGGTEVLISLANFGDGDIHLSVADNGPGFSDQALQRGTERFWRDEGSRSRDMGGSGFGLAIADAVMIAHRGSLQLMNTATQKHGAIVHCSFNGVLRLKVSYSFHSADRYRYGRRGCRA